MAELTADYITSLDGFGSAEGWPGLWGMGGPDYYAFLEEDSTNDYALLMGRNTFALFREFGESGEEDVSFVIDRPSYVFSRTLSEPLRWDNATLVTCDAVEAVRALKQESAVPLRTIGSPSLVRSLLLAGLVDRYRVVVFPVVNGATGGDRMYDGWPDVQLEVLDTRSFDNRLQLFEFVPTVLDGPPGATSGDDATQ